MFRVSSAISILLFITQLTSKLVFPQWEQQRFESLTIEDGLPINQIFALCEDSKGFLWIGTSNGLVRYDGYNFKDYTHDPSKPESLSDSWVFNILEDIRSEYSIYFAPFNTKISCIGMWSVWLKNRDISIWNAQPMEYNLLNYSKGFNSAKYYEIDW